MPAQPPRVPQNPSLEALIIIHIPSPSLPAIHRHRHSHGWLTPLSYPATTLWHCYTHTKLRWRREKGGEGRRNEEKGEEGALEPPECRQSHRSRGCHPDRLHQCRGSPCTALTRHGLNSPLHPHPTYPVATVSPYTAPPCSPSRHAMAAAMFFPLGKDKGNAFPYHCAPRTHAHEQRPLRSNTEPHWLENACASAPAPTCSPRPHPTVVRLCSDGSRMVEVEKPPRQASPHQGIHPAITG